MCTGIKLISDNSSVVYARTLEFAKDLESQILMIPRSYQFIGTTNKSNVDGLKWKSRYAAVGANAAGINYLVDGVNEAGLAGGLFYFPEYAHYQNIDNNDYSNSIAPWQLLTWILTNFKDIDEVKNELPKIKVTNTIFEEWGIILPIHCIIHDINGNSLVIEYINGNLILTNNPIGVFTNSPSFDWHVTNLRNYINLSAVNVSKVQLKNIKLTSLGQGSGMLGLPGDFTSPSRFIRAVAYAQSCVNIKNENDGVNAAFHLLNLFDIPYGAVRDIENNVINFEYTQWTSCIDLKNKTFYIHMYKNRNVQKIELLDLDLNSKEPVLINLINDQITFDLNKIKQKEV